MLWKARVQKVCTAALLALCTLQSITPDTHDLASNTIFHVVLQTGTADFPIDADESPDDVCGPTWTRGTALDFENHAAPRRPPAALRAIAPESTNARFITRTRTGQLGTHAGQLDQLCRLNC